MKISSIILTIFFVLSAEAILCGGNCPRNYCVDCPCGSTQEYVDVVSWCKRYTWDQTCCECIIQKESAGNRYAMNYNPQDESLDVGLWQINSFNWPYCGITADNACNLNKNFACAKQVYAWGGNTWKFWTTADACGCASSP